MDTKLLSAPESNNTLARCWFRRNIPVTTFGCGGAIPIPYTLLTSNCQWDSSIGLAFVSAVLGRWPPPCYSITSLKIRWQAVVGVGVTIVVIVVVVVVESSSVVKLSFVIT
ncbi:hypothetical protein Tco_0617126 [Tanacetum coccineum]|uniref:Transmembrane protein n=1 Tax=Tanacetum coccineum TaxID=301880 RepID=A0ABQ5BQP5_9ASTR